MDTKDIPQGDYCYEILSIERSQDPKSPPIIKTKVCPYLKKEIDPEYDEERLFCSLVKEFDILLDDNVKICGINDDFSSEEENV